MTFPSILPILKKWTFDYQRRRGMNLLPLVFLLIENEDDRAFMENLYTQYHRLMYAQAMRILNQSEAAEDAVSESLMALMKKISLLRPMECNKLRSYVVITVKHTAITMLNKGKRMQLPGQTVREAGEGFIAGYNDSPHWDDRFPVQLHVRYLSDEPVGGFTLGRHYCLAYLRRGKAFPGRRAHKRSDFCADMWRSYAHYHPSLARQNDIHRQLCRHRW